MNETSSKNEITSGIIWKQLLLFFFPILLGSFFQQLYNTIDAVIVGRFVGKNALAAVAGSSGMVINLLVNFFTGLNCRVLPSSSPSSSDPGTAKRWTTVFIRSMPSPSSAASS